MKPNGHNAIRKAMMSMVSITSIRKIHEKRINITTGLMIGDFISQMTFHGPDDGRESRPRYDIIQPILVKACAKAVYGMALGRRDNSSGSRGNAIKHSFWQG
ncbi:MAG: hypothetical protein MZV70_31625 [Desulfobacterales bacterium]|nr:hypothetical protein [Desulfobacterales bacterium]